MRKLLLLTIFLGLLVLSTNAQEPNLFPVKKNGKAGYIDRSGKAIIPLKFDEVRGFAAGLAAARIGDDWGYIDSTGKFVIKPQFFAASEFVEGFAQVGVYWPNHKIINGSVGYDGYIDKTGTVISKDRFGVAFGFSDGLAKVQTEDYKNGFIDKTGNVVVYADSSSGFHDGLAMYKTNSNLPDSMVGYIDKSGKVAIPAKFTFGLDFSEGLACVSSDRGSGFIDTKGDVVIDFKFDDCGSFSEGLASVRMNGLIGFIDKSGKVVIDPQFTPVIGAETRFADGVAVVQVGETEKSTKEGLRDVTLAGGNILANKSGFFGVIDKTGKFIVEPKYVQIGDFHDGLAWVNLSDAYIIHGDTNRWGYLNKQGRIVWKSF